MDWALCNIRYEDSPFVRRSSFSPPTSIPSILFSCCPIKNVIFREAKFVLIKYSLRDTFSHMTGVAREAKFVLIKYSPQGHFQSRDRDPSGATIPSFVLFWGARFERWVELGVGMGSVAPWFEICVESSGIFCNGFYINVVTVLWTL